MRPRIFIFILLAVVYSTSAAQGNTNANAVATQSQSQEQQRVSIGRQVAEQVTLLLQGFLRRLISIFQSIHRFGRAPQISSANDFGKSGGSGSGSGRIIINQGLVWNGVRATARELESLTYIRLSINEAFTSGTLSQSPWLFAASDTDLLRFLRHQNGNKDEALKAVKAHAAWRTSSHGCETLSKSKRFEKSVLNRQLFWLGVSQTGCPTLVIRTQGHDGVDYNDDPREFTSFVVWVLEQGRLKYGAIDRVPICVILDRGAYYHNGKRKGHKPDFSVIPRLVELLKLLFSTIINNYPEILSTARIVPVNFFFKMCYKVTSRVMDAKTRDKFVLISGDRATKDMSGLFPAAALPPHLGGTSTKGGRWDDGQWDRPELVREMMGVLTESDKESDKDGNSDSDRPASARAGAGAGVVASMAGVGGSGSGTSPGMQAVAKEKKTDEEKDEEEKRSLRRRPGGLRRLRGDSGFSSSSSSSEREVVVDAISSQQTVAPHDREKEERRDGGSRAR